MRINRIALKITNNLCDGKFKSLDLKGLIRISRKKSSLAYISTAYQYANLILPLRRYFVPTTFGIQYFTFGNFSFVKSALPTLVAERSAPLPESVVQSFTTGGNIYKSLSESILFP